MNWIANSYQITDRSRFSVTEYLIEEKTHAAINNNLFKRLAQISDQIYEVELVNSNIELKEPILKSQSLTLAEKDLFSCIRKEKEQ